MAPERTQRLWRALGFPDVADDDPAFTDADVAALGVLSSLIDSGFVGPDTEASIARAMGQSLSRLADWQTDLLADALIRGAGGERPAGVDPTRRSTAARALLPLLQAVQDYVWRRHLAANADRLLVRRPGRATGGSSPSASPTWSATPPAAAAWAGASSARWSRTSRASPPTVIARHPGRVVKTVGDGVLFTAVSAVDAVEIGLRPARGRGTPRTGRRCGSAPPTARC